MTTAEWLTIQETILIYAFFMGILATFVAYKLQFFKLPVISAPLTHLSFLKVLGAFFAYILVQLIIFPLFLLGLSFKGLFFGEKQVILGAEIIGTVHIVAIFFSALVVYIYLKRAGKLVLPSLQWKNFVQDALKPFFYGLLSLFLVFPLTKLLGGLIALFSFHFFGYLQAEQLIVKNLQALLHYPLLFSFAALLIVFFIPFVEEVLFRGFLQTWLKERWGRTCAYLLSSFFFALFHFEYALGVGNLEVLLSLFLIGLFLSHLKEKKQTLWAPIGLHASFNALSIIALTFNLESIA